MPRKPARSSLADEQAAPGGAAAVDRALSLLAAFRPGDGPLGLAELASRTRLYKSTVLRLLASLVHAQFLCRGADGRFSPGPAAARLHAAYLASFSLEAALLPLLHDLVAQTAESAAFHVRQGDQRLCLLRVDSPQLLRDHVRAGDLLPLQRGAGGRVLLAFGEPAAHPGPPYEQIRRDGVAVLTDDRVVGLTGISAPVWGADGRLAGALTLTLPESRMRPGFVGAVVEAAARATQRLAGPVAAGATPTAT